MASQKRSEARKAQIIEAAQHVFAEKGFQEATISDVARRAKVSDATIYEYFSSKEELLFTIPLETSQKGNEVLAFHLDYVRGAANRLRSVIYHYLWFYQNNRDYASVVMLILKTNRKFIDTEAYGEIRKGYRLILKILEEGMASGEFKQDLSPVLVRAVILGTMEHLVIRSLLLGKPEKLVDLVDPVTDLVIDGIKKDQPRNLNITLNLDGLAGAIAATTGDGG